jgi:hypothetical protein
MFKENKRSEKILLEIYKIYAIFRHHGALWVGGGGWNDHILKNKSETPTRREISWGERTDGPTNRATAQPTNGPTNGSTNGLTNRQTNGQTKSLIEALACA